MNLHYIPRSERLLSGTLSLLLSDSATEATLSNPPSSSKLPTYIEFEPDSTANRELCRVVKVVGSVATIERGLNNGGVGIEHQPQSAYKQKMTSLHFERLAETIESGWLLEDPLRALIRVSDTQFTITGYGASDDLSAFYSVNRFIRVNGLDANEYIITSSSYNAGTNKTTVNITGVLPGTLTTMELVIWPSGMDIATPLKASAQSGGMIYAADAGASDTYAITLVPALTAYVAGNMFHFKANTVNTGPCTLNVNGLGAKTIKKNYNSDLEDGDILANQLVSVIYDGINFQMLSPVAPLLSPTSTSVMSNKRRKLRVDTQATTDTITPEISTYDCFVRTAQAHALVINNHSTSTPNDCDMMEFIILGDATPRAITYGDKYVAKSGTALPSTTVASKCTKLLFQWRASLSQWDLLTATQEA